MVLLIDVVVVEMVVMMVVVMVVIMILDLLLREVSYLSMNAFPTCLSVTM